MASKSIDPAVVEVLGEMHRSALHKQSRSEKILALVKCISDDDAGREHLHSAATMCREVLITTRNDMIKWGRKSSVPAPLSSDPIIFRMERKWHPFKESISLLDEQLRTYLFRPNQEYLTPFDINYMAHLAEEMIDQLKT